MKRIVLLAVFAVLYMVVAIPALASQQEDKAVELVDKTVSMVQSQGLDKTIAAVNDPHGGFVDGELYVFIQKNDGTTLAHGGNPALCGRNMMGLKDSDGVPFIKVQTEQAKKGPGWVTYKWTNPATKKLQAKATYVKAVPGTDVWVGCGVYQ